MVTYSELVELYNEAVDTVTKYNYPEYNPSDSFSLAYRVQVEMDICQRRLGMMHPDSLLGQIVSRGKLEAQYKKIISIYGQDPNPHRKKPAA